MRFAAPLPPATRHLVDRFTYGVNDTLVADVRKRGGATGWFDAQLTRKDDEYPAARLVPTWFPLLRSPAQVNYLGHLTGTRTMNVQGDELVGLGFALKILSRHQVYEAMVDFWSNLLYVPVAEDRSFPWRADYEFSVIRPHALGSYTAMLRAAIVHPSMATFLTNDLNYKGAINENLGRELLELHTVGRVYRERDVVNASRMLTGFTVNVLLDSRAAYDPGRHDTGRIRVLGFSHTNRLPDGRAALNEMLGYLARHPATSKRIAERLCHRFVSDDPSPRMVDDVARAYRASGTNIRATLRALVRHPQFQKARRKKIWTPADDVVRTARVMSLVPGGLAIPGESFIEHLVDTARDMGHLPLRWPQPDGWPETSGPYLSASRVLRGWQHHYDLAATDSALLRGVQVASKASQLPTTWPRTLGELVDHQSQRLLGRPADRTLVSAVAGTLGRSKTYRYRSAAALSDREYQLLRGTVLNSPAGLQR